MSPLSRSVLAVAVGLKLFGCAEERSVVCDTAPRPGQTVRVVVRDAETQEALCDATVTLQVDDGLTATLARGPAYAAVSCSYFVQLGRHWNPPTRATVLVSLDGYVPEAVTTA